MFVKRKCTLCTHFAIAFVCVAKCQWHDSYAFDDAFDSFVKPQNTSSLADERVSRTDQLCTQHQPQRRSPHFSFYTAHFLPPCHLIGGVVGGALWLTDTSISISRVPRDHCQVPNAAHQCTQTQQQTMHNAVQARLQTDTHIPCTCREGPTTTTTTHGQRKHDGRASRVRGRWGDGVSSSAQKTCSSCECVLFCLHEQVNGCIDIYTYKTHNNCRA